MAMDEEIEASYDFPTEYNVPDGLRMSSPENAQKRAIRATIRQSIAAQVIEGTIYGVQNDVTGNSGAAIVSESQRETLFYSPIHRTISSLEVGQSVVVTSTDLAQDAYSNLWGKDSTPTLESRCTVPSMEGGELKAVRDRGLAFVIHPVTGEHLTPGFEYISKVGNEGMVCMSTLGKSFMITAKDQQAAIRTYLERPGDDPMLAYPIFLNDSELLVTRFDADAAKAQNHHTLRQLQGKDPFGLEKETADPTDKKGRETFDHVMQIVQSHENNRITPLEYAFDESAAHIYFPDIDTENISAQMVVSRYVDGGIVVSLQEKLDAHSGRQGGFFLIRHPNGKVMLCDMGYSQAVDGRTPKQEKTFSDALEYIMQYNGHVIGLIASQPIDRSQLRRKRNRP